MKKDKTNKRKPKRLVAALKWIEDARLRIHQSLADHTPLDRVDLSDSLALAQQAIELYTAELFRKSKIR